MLELLADQHDFHPPFAIWGNSGGWTPLLLAEQHVSRQYRRVETTVWSLHLGLLLAEQHACASAVMMRSPVTLM